MGARLLTNAKILSYGGFAEYDLRNNSRGLAKGAYFYGRIGSYQGLKDKPAFSDYGWLEAELDARGYIPLGSDKTSLAVRGYASLKDPRGGSQIPFYDQSFLGGRMYGRGFKTFRFRGNNMALGSAELRQTVGLRAKIEAWTFSPSVTLDRYGETTGLQPTLRFWRIRSLTQGTGGRRSVGDSSIGIRGLSPAE